MLTDCTGCIRTGTIGLMSTVSGVSSVLLQGITWQQYVNLRDLEENNHVRMTYDRGDLELMLPSRLPYVVLEGVTWRQYVELRDNPQNDHVRMTFDQGGLELMSPTRLHERVRILIAKCIDVWVEERRIPIQSCGSTTFRREDLERGIEPDNCYYIQHESAVRERDEIDLSIDPPPDLAIEVDLSCSSFSRMPTYAGLGIPEVWRWQKEKLQLYRLDASQRYVEASASIALQGFPIEQLVDMVKRRSSADETTLLREFRAACRQIAGGRE